jgi:hypothetical protein
VNETSTINGPTQRSRLFGVVTGPAKLVSRYRADLRAALDADAETFARAAARVFFFVLAGLALAYPVVVSIAHAIVGRPSGTDTLTMALRPFFDVVYAESLTFMIVAVGIGTFSPALGVLFVAVFIPADLIAASRSPVELRALQALGALPAPVLGRLISYGLLWILAVEIPMLGRRWAAALAYRTDGGPAALAGSAGRMAATAFAVFAWARSLPWLIQPVFQWIPYQFTPEASAPTWIHWPVLVIAAIAIAGAASIWPKPAEASMGSVGPTHEMGELAPLSRLVLRHTVAVLILVALLAGLMTTWLEAMILIVGLFVAGPVLTLILPRMKVPAGVAGMPVAARWVLSMGIALAVFWAILILAGDATYESYLVMVLALAVVAPLFRFLLDAGVARQVRSRVPETRPGSSTSRGVSAIILLVLAFSLAFPATAWADDCPGRGEMRSCLRMALVASLAMASFALGLLGAMTSYNREPFQGMARRSWQQRFRRIDDAVQEQARRDGEGGRPSSSRPGGRQRK